MTSFFFINFICLITNFRLSISNSEKWYTLSLFNEDEKASKIDHNKYPFLKKENGANYCFDYYLYDGYPLSFKSIDHNNPKRVSLQEISKYSLVTLEELKELLIEIMKNQGMKIHIITEGPTLITSKISTLWKLILYTM